jgi:hypothetical protein
MRPSSLSAGSTSWSGHAATGTRALAVGRYQERAALSLTLVVVDLATLGLDDREAAFVAMPQMARQKAAGSGDAEFPA